MLLRLRSISMPICVTHSLNAGTRELYFRQHHLIYT
uniref:Uncharacterized protein n=1 Tax=Ascaris lumbricoides TaxID=6252 RepID=A0A0M3HJB3_ASCLU